MARNTRRPSGKPAQAEHLLGDVLGSALGNVGEEGGLLGGLLESLAGQAEQGGADTSPAKGSTRKRSTTGGAKKRTTGGSARKKSASASPKKKATSSSGRKTAAAQSTARKKKSSTKPAAKRTTRKSTKRQVRKPAAAPAAQSSAPSAMEDGLGMLKELLGGAGGSSGNVAQAVLGFVLRKLLAGGGASRVGAMQGAAQADAPSLGDLLQHVGGEEQADRDYLNATGLPQELAQETGLDLDKATTALQGALKLLGGRQSA